MKNFKYLFIVLLAVVFAVSCSDDEDFTGYSTQTATSNTSVSIEGVDESGYSLVESDVTYTFPVKVSNPQITDVVLYVSQTDGDATEGADFTFSSKVIVPALATEGVLEVSILSDDILEGTESFSLQVGDDQTANATVNPVTVKFDILNATGDDLGISMSWDTDASDALGIDLSPTEAVDLRLLILHADTLFAVADGGSFEASMILGNGPDGNYKVAADIYSTVDAGDFNSPLSIDLSLEFNQAGTINSMTLDYPASMTNEFACDLYRTCLADITKSGSSYEISRNYSLELPTEVQSLTAGAWAGTDAYTIQGGVTDNLTSRVEVTAADLIYGLNEEWMTGFWGEEILVRGEVAITVNNGVVDIAADQYIFTTLYDGAEYPYTVSGTGVISQSCDGFIMTIEYVLDQEGFDPSGWAFDNGFQNEPVFTATLSL